MLLCFFQLANEHSVRDYGDERFLNFVIRKSDHTASPIEEPLTRIHLPQRTPFRGAAAVGPYSALSAAAGSAVVARCAGI